MSQKSAPGNYKEQQHHFITKEWTADYFTRNTTNKALINFDANDDETDGSIAPDETHCWSELPDLILEKIFSYLTMRERYYASQICRNWYRAFHMPYVWSRFTLEDLTLTRARYNYYQGWQYVLDHVRTQMCFTQVGHHVRTLTIAPMLNFLNLSEFVKMLNWYIEQGDNPAINACGIGAKIRNFKFTFLCNMDYEINEKAEHLKVFGTGGRILSELKRLIMNLPRLQRLELHDLMLEYFEAQHLLDGVCDMCCTTLHTLILINTTQVQLQLLHLGVFLNLKVLVISPQNLGDDVIELLGYTNLQYLRIHQNVYTPDYITNCTSPQAWKSCRKNNPFLRVHLQMESVRDKRLLIWPGAPVKSVIYDGPNSGVQLAEIMNITENYREDLVVYGHKCIPADDRIKEFYDRIDEPLIILSRNCHNLETLIISECISTTTILLIVSTCKRLRDFYVRRQAVINNFDWEINPNWSDEFLTWLQYTANDFDRVQSEVSQILGFKWAMLSDINFKRLSINDE